MKILKNNTKEVFDTSNIDKVTIWNGAVPGVSNALHHNHDAMSDYDFLSRYFPEGHKIFDNFTHSFYYVIDSNEHRANIIEIDLTAIPEDSFKLDLEAVRATNPKDLKEFLIRLAALQEFPNDILEEEAQYFKADQGEGIFHYYKIIKNGSYLLNFLNKSPVISYESLPLPPPFCYAQLFENAHKLEEITKEEFNSKWEEALANPDTKFIC